MQLSQAAQETYEYEVSCGTTPANAQARAERVMNTERRFNPAETGGVPELHFTDEPAFYASCVDAGRTGLLAGPFATHAEALNILPEARRIACEVNSWAWFYAFGTVQMKNGRRPGVLNERFEL